MADLDKKIQEKIGDNIQEKDIALPGLSSPPIDIFEDAPTEDGTPRGDWDPVEAESVKPEADEFTAEAYDEYLTAQVVVPLAGELTKGKVLKRKRDDNGNPTGVRNDNPILDTRQYEIEFPDGEIHTYTANVIAESLYSQVDSEGHESLYLAEIMDHKSNASAVTKDDAYITSNGRKVPRRTTIGWKLLCKWKDSSTSWVPLKDIKESYPIQVAE